jgi:hypothetical protein
MENTRYQFSKAGFGRMSRLRKETPAKFGFDGHENDFMVYVTPIDVDGNFSIEPLKNRGYIYKQSAIFANKVWIKFFATQAAAEAEIDALCETGI